MCVGREGTTEMHWHRLTTGMAVSSFCRHHDKALFLTGILMQIEVAMPVLKELFKVLGETARHLFANSLMKAVNVVGKLRQASWERDQQRWGCWNFSSCYYRENEVAWVVLLKPLSLLSTLSLFPPFSLFLPLPPFSLYLWSRENNLSTLKEDSKGT